MLEWEMLHPRMTEAHLGYLALWLSANNPKPAREQIDDNYRHGGGWQPFHGFRLDENNALHHLGDAPLYPLAQARLRDELVVFYLHDWVAIIQPDRSFETCRVD